MIIVYLFTFFIGFILFKLLLPKLENKFLVIGFSLSLGIIIEAFLMFLLMTFNLNNRFCLFLTLFIVTVVLLILNFKINHKADIDEKVEERKDTANKFILISFVIISLLIFVLMGIHIIKEPDGSWDALFIWNLRPKFFFLLNQLNMDWRQFYNPVIEWTHLDYPILLPVYNYLNHLLVGKYDILINLFSAIIIALAVITSLIGGIKEFRGINNALIAGIVLMCSNPFLWESMTQCADIILSLFILNAFISLFLYEKYKMNSLLFLSFLFASTCSFCKNEGILFFVVFCFLAVFFVKNKNIKIMLSAVSVPLLCLLYTKLFLYGKSDLTENQTISTLISKISDINRYNVIFIQYINNLFSLYVPIFAIIMAFVSGIAEENKYTNIKNMLFLTLIFIFIGYTIVYLLSPRDLIWHLETSSMRLVAQYIPLTILGLFIAFNCCDKRKL